MTYAYVERALILQIHMELLKIAGKMTMLIPATHITIPETIRLMAPPQDLTNECAGPTNEFSTEIRLPPLDAWYDEEGIEIYPEMICLVCIFTS